VVQTYSTSRQDPRLSGSQGNLISPPRFRRAMVVANKDQRFRIFVGDFHVL
jgi:hypothetical protein